MFTAPLFTIAKMWKQSECPSMDEGIKKMSYMYTMEYYPILKKKEILPYVATFMKLEDVMLSEISQSQKEKCCMIPFL